MGSERKKAFEEAAQDCRYYLKHQNYPTWFKADEFQKGVMVACENLEKIMLEKAKSLPDAPADDSGRREEKDAQ